MVGKKFALCMLCLLVSLHTCCSFSGEALQKELEKFVNGELAAKSFQEYIDRDVEYDNNPDDKHFLLEFLSKGLSSKLSERITALKNMADLMHSTQPTKSRNLETCCEAYLSETDPRFHMKVNLEKPCEWGEGRHEAQKHVPNQMHDVMRENLIKWPSLKWQYYASEEGLVTVYPGNKLCDENYDPRFRPFYVEAATPRPKDVVLVIDTSGSMGDAVSGSRDIKMIDVAISAVKSVIDTLNPNDRVGVVSFSTDAVTPPGNDETTCYETQLAKATPENRKYLNQYVNKLKAVYDTYYIDALNKAFDFFENTQKGMFDNFKRDKVILFMSDGKPTDYGDKGKEIISTIRERNADVNDTVIILTYGIGAATTDAANILTEMTEVAAKGERSGNRYTPVSNHLDLRYQMSTYYQLFAVSDADNPVTFTVPYIDAFGLGLMTTACLPVIQSSTLAGVVCVDITLGDLFNEVTGFTQGELSYAFVVDGHSRLLSHPMMPRPYEIEDEPIFVNMPAVEANSDEIRISMISGGSGEKELRSRRSFSRGVTKKDGVISKGFDATYMWAPIEKSNFSLCLVFAKTDKPHKLTNAPFDTNFRYHLLVFGETDGLCKHFNRLARKDMSTVKFSPEAFIDPIGYLERIEDENDIMRYSQYMKGRTNTNDFFKKGIRDSVGITLKFDELLKPSDYAVWRYMATDDGVFRVIPGIAFQKGYDGTVRPWYRRAVGNRGLISVSTPYEDAFGAGTVVTLSRALFHAERSGSHNSDNPVLGVISLDFSLTNFIYQIVAAYPQCNTTEKTCFVIDNSGYIVMHDDFALTTDRSKVEDIHIIKKEPNIANYIIDYGYLQSEQCVDHQKHRIKKTWLMKSGTTISGNNFELKAVSGTNVFVVMKNNRGDAGGQFCSCRSSGTDVKCTDILCECPCYSHANTIYSYCSGTVQTKEDITLCTPIVMEPKLEDISQKEKDAVRKVDTCFDLDCETKNNSNCGRYVGCGLCGNSCENQQETKCSGQGGSDSGGLGIGAIVGIVIGVAVITLIVIVMAVCLGKRKQDNKSSTTERDSGHVNVGMSASSVQAPSRRGARNLQPVTPTENVSPPAYADVTRANSRGIRI